MVEFTGWSRIGGWAFWVVDWRFDEPGGGGCLGGSGGCAQERLIRGAGPGFDMPRFSCPDLQYYSQSDSIRPRTSYFTNLLTTEACILVASLSIQLIELPHAPQR